MADTEFPVKESDILQSETTGYLIKDFTGEGSFGKVAKCLNLTTNEVVAIKIFKDDDEEAIKAEVEMLQALMSLDPDKSNIVRFIESFKCINLHCLVFEMLDRDLWGLVDEREERCETITLNEIRPVIHQLITALHALRRQGIMHTDLKTDNVMLVDHLHQPYKIKLIDFGQAMPQTEAEQGKMMQHCAFRAPEVFLGAPLTTAVDMWGLGCVMAHLYFGEPIFPYECPYDWMRTALKLLGEPDQWTLLSGQNMDCYFKWNNDIMNPGCKISLLTPDEFQETTGSKADVETQLLEDFMNLDHAVLTHQANGDPLEWRDKQEFLNLLKCCLTFSPSERITPRQALSHNFLTMVHLAGEVDTSVYAETAFHLMSVAVQSDLDESDGFNGVNNNRPLTAQHRRLFTEASTAAYSSNMSAEVDSNDDSALSSPPLDGAADATDRGGPEDVTTEPNADEKKSLFKRLRRFLGTGRKRVRSIFHVCIEINSLSADTIE